MKRDNSIGSFSGSSEKAGKPKRKPKNKEKATKEPEMKSFLEAVDPILLEVCKANCVKVETLAENEKNIETLNIFQMQRLSSLVFLDRFRHLKELCIIQQPQLKSLKGVESCPTLEKLWATQCSLQELDVFANNLQLREIYLNGNCISKLPNLTHLNKLEKLWLCDNKIRKFTHFKGPESLICLHLARNQIERFGDAFDSLIQLRELNLSDNIIGCFKDVLKLSRLRSLRVLNLCDPHFGDNPVCKLYNYQTFLLYHLSQLTCLDTMNITEDSKQLTETTYMKKRMYYNMRVKTLKRNCTNAIRLGLEIRQSKISRVNLNLNVLLRQKKDIDREIEERQYNLHQEAAANCDYELLQNRQNSLENTIEQKSKEIVNSCFQFEKMKREVCRITDESISHLMLELETGGNIRLVEGNPNDPWYISCVELLKSRFRKSNFDNLGITGIKINRVMRIHNRFLRNRFDETVSATGRNVENFKNGGKRNSETYTNGENKSQLQSTKNGCTDSSNQSDNNGRQLEYSFYLEQPGQCQYHEDFIKIIEEGFKKPYKYPKMGHKDAGIPFRNCLSEYEQKMCNSLDKIDANEVNNNKRKLIVTKMYLGEYAEKSYVESKKQIETDIKAGDEYVWCDDSDDESKSLSSVENKMDSSAMIKKPSFYKGYHTVYENIGEKQQYKKWLAFDQRLCLPEYLVDFEYEGGKQKKINDTTAAARPANDEILGSSFVSMLTPQEIADLGPLLPSLEEFNNVLNDYSSNTLQNNNVLESHTKIPILSERPKLTAVDAEILASWSKSPSLSKLTYLNVHGNNIRSMAGIEICTALKVLVMSFNELFKIQGLENMIELERVDLSFNLIKRIEGLQNLSKLETLELNNNLIYRLEDLTTLQKNSLSLRHLNIRNNAICEVKNYESMVLQKIDKLVTLDSKPVTKDDIVRANENVMMITDSLIKECAKGSTDSIIFHSTGHESINGAASEHDNSSWQQVETLGIQHKRIRRLENLELLTKLRSASFSDNDLSRIESLQNCTLLEELSLEENRILKIEGLKTLTFLKKLDIGKNKLKRLENLDTLVNLAQLSVEDNEIQSLKGLENLQSLMELYIGNNRISDLKEIQHLTVLKKLIILDLLGNPVCKKSSYRLYSIYYLCRLKVLDGIGIDSVEQGNARKKYSGKLTAEFLQGKIGHKYYEHIRELDISSCRIHEIEMLSISGDQFSNLKEINLSNNNLKSISGLSRLPQLQVLRLNNNKIGSLEIPEGSDLSTVSVNQLGELMGENLPEITECGLAGMHNLEVLQLGNNRVVNIEALSLHLLPNLKVLFLQGNAITKISGLKECRELRELVLDKNKLRHLDNIHEEISNLTNLRALRLEENSIRTLGSFDSLVKLHSLYLGFNRISDMCELEKLSGIPLLLEISIANNPVTRKQFYRPTLIYNLPALKFVDGKGISEEERERVDGLFSGDNRNGVANASYGTTYQNNEYSLGFSSPPNKRPGKTHLTNSDVVSGLGIVGIQTKPMGSNNSFFNVSNFSRGYNAPSINVRKMGGLPGA